MHLVSGCCGASVKQTSLPWVSEVVTVRGGGQGPLFKQQNEEFLTKYRSEMPRLLLADSVLQEIIRKVVVQEVGHTSFIIYQYIGKHI